MLWFHSLVVTYRAHLLFNLVALYRVRRRQPGQVPLSPRATRRIVLGFAVALCCCLARAIAQPGKPEPVALTEEGQKWVEQALKGLSLEEKVGQMLQVRYYADYPSFDNADYKYLRNELRKYHIGSVVLAAHINRLGLVRSAPLDAARVANQLQRDSKLPLLVAADLERGVASRLKDVPPFPWPMAFGAVNDVSVVKRFGTITAREARAVGVQWALAPVADVNSNPANPVINDRSFGEDPEEVAALVAAFIRGAHENGLLVTAKHFPGHGESAVDSHREVPLIGGDLAHLERFEFPPFRRAIEAHVDSILLAHARVPAVEPDPARITTISSRVVNDTLKGRLGFKGVVLTDALEMRGMTALYDPRQGSPTARAAVEAVKAGCDVVMIPTDLGGAFQAILEAVRSGDIGESRLDESVRKILQMKASVGLNKSRLVDLEHVAALVSTPEDMQFAQQVADQAITLVRDNGRILPLQRFNRSSKDGHASLAALQAKYGLVAVILAEALESGRGCELERALKSRQPDARVFYFDGRFSGGTIPEVLKAVKGADKVVIAAYLVHRASQRLVVGGQSVQSFGLVGPSGGLLQQVLATAPEKTAVVALGSPYLIWELPSDSNLYLHVRDGHFV